MMSHDLNKVKGTLDVGSYFNTRFPRELNKWYTQFKNYFETNFDFQ